MMIPPPKFVAPDGVRVYTRDPVLRDVTTERGEFTGGRRIDRVTYVFEKPGDFALPAVGVGWFDAASGKRQNAVAPEIRLSVAPNPHAAAAIAPEPAPEAAAPKEPPHWQRRLAWAAATAIALIGMAWLVRRVLQPLRARLAVRRKAHEESEAAYFNRLMVACGSSDAAATYRALLAWRRRAGRNPDSADVRGEITRLEEALYAQRGERATWSGAGLAAALSNARKGRFVRRAARPSPALPALNP
jgi:hypothetical protein